MGYPLGESEVGAKNINTTCKISIWLRYSPDHKQTHLLISKDIKTVREKAVNV